MPSRTVHSDSPSFWLCPLQTVWTKFCNCNCSNSSITMDKNNDLLITKWNKQKGQNCLLLVVCRFFHSFSKDVLLALDEEKVAKADLHAHMQFVLLHHGIFVFKNDWKHSVSNHSALQACYTYRKSRECCLASSHATVIPQGQSLSREQNTCLSNYSG